MDDNTAVEIWGRVIQGFDVTNRLIHERFKTDFNLNAAEVETLLTLHSQGDHGVPMKVLATAASFSTGGFTKIADRLSKRGLTERTACSDDRRVTYLELTDEGRKLAGHVHAVSAQANRDYVIDVLGEEQANVLSSVMATLHTTNRDVDIARP